MYDVPWPYNRPFEDEFEVYSWRVDQNGGNTTEVEWPSDEEVEEWLGARNRTSIDGGGAYGAPNLRLKDGKWVDENGDEWYDEEDEESDEEEWDDEEEWEVDEEEEGYDEDEIDEDEIDEEDDYFEATPEGEEL